MSTNRVSKQAGFVAPSQLPKGPNGRALCRQCSVEVPRGRRTFCSTACVDAWKLKTNPQHVRKLVFQRDNGICGLCGVDTLVGVRRRTAWGTGHLWQADHIKPVVEGGGECGLENYRTLCTRCHKAVTKQLRGRLSTSKREAKAQARWERWHGRKSDRPLTRARVVPIARPETGMLDFGVPS